MTQSAPAETFPCSNCGAKLAYDAATQGMACPYCSTKQAMAPQGQAGAVREIALEEGLRMAARGYGAPVTTLDCKECGATVHVGEGERTTTCAF
jgi:DNA-directed RNA polymerase subunit RPC12/RpoP